MYNEILVIKKNEILIIYDSMNGPRGYYTQWNKSEKDLYDFIYMQNLKNKINTKPIQKQTHRYREKTHGMGVGELSEKGKGIDNYKLLVTE